MANEQILPARGFVSSYRLPKTIPAIQVFCVDEGTPELGAISHLPEGAELTFCGTGFNEATIKARYGDQFYFVFLEDLPTTRRKPSNTQAGKALTAARTA